MPNGVLLSTHTAIRSYRHTFLLRPLIGAGLQTHVSSVPCRHLSDEACFLYKFRDRISCSQACMVLPQAWRL